MSLSCLGFPLFPRRLNGGGDRLEVLAPYGVRDSRIGGLESKFGAGNWNP